MGFVLREDTQKVVEEAFSDRRFAKSSRSVSAGGFGAAVSYFEGHPTPDIILIETPDEDAEILDGVRRLSEVCDPGSRVLLLGTNNDVTLYKTLIRQGVSDYIAQPVSAHELIDVVSEIVVDPSAPAVGRLIAFIGVKGGVGSSTIACNTAWSMSKTLGRDVALLDLDICFGSVGLSFNLESPQGISSVLSERDRMDEMLLDRSMTGYDEHLKLLTAPAALNVAPDIDIDALDQLFDIVRQQADFVLVDLPHQWTGWVREVLLSADDVVLTATLDLECLRHTKNIIEFLRQQRGPDAPVRLVLNRVGASRKTELEIKNFQNLVGGDKAISIASDLTSFGLAANAGEMIGESSKNAKLAQHFNDLAVALSGDGAPAKSNHKKFTSWMRKIKK